MRTLFQELVGNGTGPNCPPLTTATVKDDENGCAYTNYAYALFAVVAIIIVGIPFVVFICYVHRKVKKKQQERRLTRSASSSPYPYQPLYSDGSGLASYGAIDSSVDAYDQKNVKSPSHASIGSQNDRLSQQLDTTSVASSRASMLPAYDDVSLNNRNALANKTQGDGGNQPGKKTPGRKSSRTSHLSTDSQEKAVDQGGQYYDAVDVVSNVPKPPKPNVSKDLKTPPPKPPRQQMISDTNMATTENPVYDEVEGDDRTENGDEKTHGSPQYAVLEKPNGDSPTDDVHSEKGKGVSPSEQKQSLLSSDKQPASDPLTEMAAESPPSENRYLTVLPPTPPQQNDPLSESTGSLQSSKSLDQMGVSPVKSPTKSRTDCEEFLLGKVRAMPANERDGTFLIRDSASSVGSMVLTMYAWKLDSNKELYNFKVCLTEDGRVYLHKGSKTFSNLNGLLEYLREDKDMLPCVLKTQVFP